MRFFTSDLCRLLLEAGQLDGLWFATTYPLKNYSKSAKIRSLSNKFLNNSKFT